MSVTPQLPLPGSSFSILPAVRSQIMIPAPLFRPLAPIAAWLLCLMPPRPCPRLPSPSTTPAFPAKLPADLPLLSPYPVPSVPGPPECELPPPVASHRPCGLNCTQLTSTVWFLYVWIQFLDRRSQIFTLVSLLPLEKKFPYGWNSTRDTLVRCNPLVKLTVFTPFSRFHTCSPPLLVPTTRLFSFWSKVSADTCGATSLDTESIGSVMSSIGFPICHTFTAESTSLRPDTADTPVDPPRPRSVVHAVAYS